MNRQEIVKEVKAKLKQIQKLEKEVRGLRIKAYKLNDKKSTYKEELETRGRGKNKKTEMIGRVYFNQKWKDSDTGKYLTIERNRIVRINKIWQL